MVEEIIPIELEQVQEGIRRRFYERMDLEADGDERRGRIDRIFDAGLPVPSVFELMERHIGDDSWWKGPFDLDQREAILAKKAADLIFDAIELQVGRKPSWSTKVGFDLADFFLGLNGLQLDWQALEIKMLMVPDRKREDFSAWLTGCLAPMPILRT